MTERQPAGAQTGTADSLATALRSLAQLLEQQARVIDYLQGQEGRLADAEAALISLRRETTDLQERVARMAETIVHRLAEQPRD